MVLINTIHHIYVIPAQMKKPVSFFLVEYDHLDSFGYLLAFLSFTPPFLVAIQTTIYFTLLLTAKSTSKPAKCRNAAQIAGKLLLGQLLNELLNLTLKNTLQHPRPPANVSDYKDYGMPSSHSQFMAFLVAIFPSLAARLCKSFKVPLFFTFSIISASFLGTFLIAYGR